MEGCQIWGDSGVLNAMPPPPRSCRCQSSLGRIHDGRGGGVAFFKGSKGRVEQCEIWGNAKAGVDVQGDSSEAMVAGCKCEKERARVFLLIALFQRARPRHPSLLAPGFTMEKTPEWFFSEAAPGGWRAARSGATRMST